MSHVIATPEKLIDLDREGIGLGLSIIKYSRSEPISCGAC